MKKVLFLCTNNSARSQMAEAILRDKAGTSFDVTSAGTDPTELSPLAVTVMREIGIDISQHKVRAIDVVFREPFEWVITVCDRAKEKCPVFPLAKWLHWSIPDPDDLVSFRAVRDDLASRIDAFLSGNLIQDAEEMGYRPKNE